MSTTREKQECAFLRLEEKIGGECGKKIVSALRELYAVYGDGIPAWLAGLYDYESGGWYYSASARDNEGYLPDCESTLGGLTFPEHSGMSDGKRWFEVLPDWVLKRAGDYIEGLQDTDGYFYHPQWGKNISVNRQSRDVDTCARILRMLGRKTKYVLPTKNESSAEGKYDMRSAPERYRSLENWLAYLETLNIKENSYYAGSTLLAQRPQMIAYGEAIGADLYNITCDWLDRNVCEKTGLWSEKIDYRAANGLHKISWFYSGMGRVIPYHEAAVESALKVIMSDEPCDAVVSAYNPWHAVGAVIGNLKEHGERGAERAEALYKKVYEVAADGIRKSAEKVRPFKQPDGGLSYLPNGSCPTNQGAPSAVPDTREGDVNGNGCGSFALISSIYNSLGLSDYAVPLYGSDELSLYVSLLEGKREAYENR